MKKSRLYQVYGLYCVCGCTPEGTVRYVGQASLGAQDRFSKHVYSARHEAQWPVSRWMRKHGVDNIRYVVLETLDSGDEMDAREEYWIAEKGTLIDIGGYNILPGGMGVRGYKHAPWAKTRQAHETPREVRDKISRTLKGKYIGEAAGNIKTTQEQAEEVIARYWDGETSKQIAAAMNLLESTVTGITSGQSWKYLPRPGRPRTVKSTGRFKPGHRPPRVKLTADDVRDIRARCDAGETCREIAGRYSVTPENIRMIVSRKTWKHVE